jgi:hypothetical protein
MASTGIGNSAKACIGFMEGDNTVARSRSEDLLSQTPSRKYVAARRIGRRAQQPSSMPLTFRLSGLTVLALAAIGCNESPASAPNRPDGARPNQVVASSKAWSDTAWDTFVADISLRVTRLDSAGRAITPRNAPPIRFTLEKRRRGGEWDTRIRVKRDFWTALDREAKDPRYEDRVAGVFRAAGAKAVAENESGAVIDVEPPDPRLSVRAPKSPLPAPLAAVAGRRASARPSPMAQRIRTAAWVEGYITDRQHARQSLERLRSRAGPARGAEGSMQRYEITKGAETHRTFVDSLTGLVHGAEVIRNGKRIRTTRYYFAEQSNGSFVRRRVYSELSAAEGQSPGIIDVLFENIQLEKRGNQ